MCMHVDGGFVQCVVYVYMYMDCVMYCMNVFMMWCVFICVNGVCVYMYVYEPWCVCVNSVCVRVCICVS